MLAFAALKGATWLVISRFAGRMIDFCNLLVLARMLTPADFGLTTMAMALILVVDTVLEVPVTQALVRLDKIDKGHLDTGFTLGVLRSTVIAVIFWTSAWPYALINKEPALLLLVVILAFGPIARGFASPAIVHCSRNMNFRPIFLMELSGKVVALLAALATVLSGGGYWALVVNFVTASVVGTVVSYVVAPYKPGLSLKRWSDFSGFIGWFSSAQFISALNWQYDRFMIGLNEDKSMLGRYSVANDVAVIPTQSLIGPALQPVMSAFSQISGDPPRMKAAFLKAARFAMLISIPASLGISLTADLLTNILLGEHWHSAAPYLRILALAMLPIPYFQTLYAASLALDRPNVVFRMNAADLVLRVIMLSLGFYLFSLEGASWGRVMLSFAMFALYLQQASRFVGVSVQTQLVNIWKLVTAGAMMWMAVTAFRTLLPISDWPYLVQLMIVSIVGALVYALSLIALGLRLRIGAGRLELSDG